MISVQNHRPLSSGNNDPDMRKSLTILFLFLGFQSFSQDAASSLQKYQNGKELYNMGRYGLAMQAFKPLTSAFNENPYIRQANFYYGVSAYNENQIEVAKSSFSYLKSNYPEWDQMDEVNLWLIKCSLVRNNYGEAISSFNDLKKESSITYGTELLLSGLEKQQSFDSIQNLFEKYPNNKAVAIRMANAIASQPLLEQDKDLLYSIVEKYNLDTEKYRLIEISDSEKKKSYTVAVMLPLMLQDLQSNRANIRNQFVIDLYQGFMLGRDELKSMGIQLNVVSYDTEKSITKVKQLLSKPELQHVDLIYGPLYPGPVKLTNQFSFDYKINMFNPLSSNSQVIGNNPYSFLYMPSYETIGAYAARIVNKKAPKKNGFVFYGEDEKDSIMALNFKKKMLEEGDSAITLFKIGDANSKKIIQILTDGTEVELGVDENNAVTKANMFKIPKDSLGFVFVASENASLAASTISALETREDSIFFIGHEKWLSSQIVSFDALERLNCHLLAPGYIDKQTSQYKYFENAFKEKYHTLPTFNACLGYETAIILGRLMQKYGNHFQFEYDDASVKTELGDKYLLNHENDNQFIPIIRFEDSELKKVNLRL